MEIFLSLLAVAVLVLLGVTMLLLKRRGRVSPVTKKKLLTDLENAMKIGDPNMRILEADKVLDAAMGVWGAEGSFADKLKKLQPRFKHADAVWKAHKLRNKIAHETGAQVSHSEAAVAVGALAKAIKVLLR